MTPRQLQSLHRLQSLPPIEKMNDQEIALYVAAVVHNARDRMDRDFTRVHLKDGQRAEPTSILRDAIYTALWALQEHETKNPDSVLAGIFVDFHRLQTPESWSSPKLLDIKEMMINDD